MSQQKLVLGAAIDLSSSAPGQYKAVQRAVVNGTPPADDSTRKVIEWSLGSFKVTGYVDVDLLELGVNVSVVGISLGQLYGHLQDGVAVDVDLFAAKGSIRFYLRNGHELWVNLNLNITFDGSYDGDYLVVSI